MLLITAVFGGFLVVPSWGPAPSDVLWPELALVVWLTVVVFIAVTRRSGRVRSAITANRYLLLTKGLLLALLIPAYFGRLSLGVPVVGIAVLHLSVAFARPLLGLLTIGFFAGVTLIPAELALLAIGNSPRLAELPVLGNISDKLYHRFRRVLQWEPECSRFDAELLYTLRPGECVFENVEFSTRIHVNRLGLRDDDASLDKPAVIVLGDSAAAGWGVEQQEVFAHQLEILTGLKTLNVSVSSYGTPREFKLFERVDRSGLRYVVLQYSGNDHVENQFYIEKGLTLPGYEEKGWKLWVNWYQGHRRYFAGKYLAYSLTEVIRAPLKAAFSGDAGDSSGSDDRSRVSEGHAVRLILEEFNEMLSGVQTYVIEPGQPAGGFSFLQRLDEELSQSATLRQCCAIETVDLSDTLTREDRFVLDGHLRASGHGKIARRLAALVNAREQRSGASAAP